MNSLKKTKIVATMSDFRCTEEFVRSLAAAGMDVVRINSAHVSEQGASHIVDTVHRVDPSIPVMIDTKGPEIRVTSLAEEFGERIEFRAGDRVSVRGSDGSDATTRETVFLNVPGIVRDIPVGARLLIADGEVEL
ncbi:MAG: pyruvate kinase, partial [Alistipes sp.]|nr:pyruvate kinase [Alistipes sp.]